MPPPDSPEQVFLNEVLSYAQQASRETGVLVSVILAQWADETAWGTSQAWVGGNNFAGVSPNGRIGIYPDRAAGVAAYITTMLDPLYLEVRETRAAGWMEEAWELGRSPWAAGHYEVDGIPGQALVDIVIEHSLWLYDQPAPTPAPQPQPEDEMDPQLLVGLLYRICLKRAPDEQGFLDNVDALTTGKLTGAQMMANIQGSPEGQAVLAAERHALGLAPI